MIVLGWLAVIGGGSLNLGTIQAKTNPGAVSAPVGRRRVGAR
jgi:hypothetical protein